MISRCGYLSVMQGSARGAVMALVLGGSLNLWPAVVRAEPPTAVPGGLSQAHKDALRATTANARAAAERAGLPSSIASAAPSSPPAALPSPVPALLKASEAANLLREFQRAQASEIKAVEHRHKLELKELKSTHSIRQKEWERQEKEQRHKFFAEHPRGPDRRGYIKDFMERRRNFQQLLKDETASRANEQGVRVQAMKQDQVSRLKEFQAALAKGERPPQQLWPASN